MANPFARLAALPLWLRVPAVAFVLLVITGPITGTLLWLWFRYGRNV